MCKKVDKKSQPEGGKRCQQRFSPHILLIYNVRIDTSLKINQLQNNNNKLTENDEKSNRICERAWFTPSRA